MSPTIKHLFTGYDVTIFAYGSTGTGKTHTMRGGKSLADRGMIPRMLSGIYRKGKALEKSTNGETTVDVSMQYYEIYNDKVFDLFETPDKRGLTGLPIREVEGGKTIVAGLTEVPIASLKEFEALYDKANANRSTGATKLNAHSSRSHAILCIKLTVTTPTETRVSTASAIDLAGSEDNRRTGNGKDRMVESASINKSLFVLASCVEAISKKQQRIPYRDSKMTRILSLGQNNGFTILILNLACTKSFHLDTLSSLNFANRTKKIEVREVENESVFKGPARQPAGAPFSGPNIQRQPLRPLMSHININLASQRENKSEKPAKAFSVYSDRARALNQRPSALHQRSSPHKRAAEGTLSSRPTKISRPTLSTHNGINKLSIESIVEAKVTQLLASRSLTAAEPPPQKDISVEVQARLDSIEKRLQGEEGDRAEGLSYLFMAKQHQARGEDGSALKMYEMARPYFDGNEKLERKIERLREKIEEKKDSHSASAIEPERPSSRCRMQYRHDENDESYHDDGAAYNALEDEDDHSLRAKAKRPKASRKRISSPDPLADDARHQPTPRTKHLLDVINTRDIHQIKLLQGVGAKRAGGIISFLADFDDGFEVSNWKDLTSLKGVGKKTLETMREGVAV